MDLLDLPPPEEMYRALVRRDPAYEGVFVLGVRTTGIFCRPTCPARKPKRENVDWFPDARGAVLAGFRPCKRCRPLEPAGLEPSWARALLADVEEEPERRWTAADLRERGLEPATVRRWFQRHHGMSFAAYARARRLGTALGRIRQGADLTEAGYEAGFESTSGFRDAFARLFGETPARARTLQPVTVTRVLTPLGAMIAAATEEALCLLEFADRRMLGTQVKRLQGRLAARFVPGDNEVLASIQDELDRWFAGSLRRFETPIVTPGTDFQQAVWEGLQRIPYGETRSYAEQARALGRPEAVRAVARANGDNRLAIVIPCHRVVGSDGRLTGYGGALWRKRALLAHERAAGVSERGTSAAPGGR